MSTERYVLMLHRVVEAPEQPHDLSRRSFLQLVEKLVALPVTADLGLESNGAAAVLSFDDGTSDHVAAGELLAANDLQAIFFVSAGRLEVPGYLEVHELEALRSLGHRIASHGYGHVRLDGLTVEQLRHEIANSRTRLEEALGTEVTYFAPAGGSTHPELRSELERAGYTASRSTRWGIYRSSAERFSIPCIPVTELTVARGWVEAVLARRSLPWTMRATYTAKQLLPSRAQSAAREWTHRRALR